MRSRIAIIIRGSGVRVPSPALLRSVLFVVLPLIGVPVVLPFLRPEGDQHRGAGEQAEDDQNRGDPKPADVGDQRHVAAGSVRLSPNHQSSPASPKVLDGHRLAARELGSQHRFRRGHRGSLFQLAKVLRSLKCRSRGGDLHRPTAHLPQRRPNSMLPPPPFGPISPAARTRRCRQMSAASSSSRSRASSTSSTCTPANSPHRAGGGYRGREGSLSPAELPSAAWPRRRHSARTGCPSRL